MNDVVTIIGLVGCAEAAAAGECIARKSFAWAAAWTFNSAYILLVCALITARDMP